MPQRTDVFDLQRLGLTSGEGRRLDLHVRVEPFSFGGQAYAAEPRFELDAREVEQPGAGDEELSSPYVDQDGELDVAAWARDALALSLPAQITCTPECAGLCPQCGANLNEDPDHAHEAEPDPRWAKLSEIRFE